YPEVRPHAWNCRLARPSIRAHQALVRWNPKPRWCALDWQRQPRSHNSRARSPERLRLGLALLCAELSQLPRLPGARAVAGLSVGLRRGRPCWACSFGVLALAPKLGESPALDCCANRESRCARVADL